jgi:hypothetical protein
MFSELPAAAVVFEDALAVVDGQRAVLLRERS